MHFQFRSHREHLPSNADGYFFCKSAIGSWNMTWEYFLGGVVQNDIVHVTRWKVPELVVEAEEERDREKCLECLILKPKLNS